MKVAVLKGGRSLERQVSLRSGARVEDALHRLGHEVVPIDVGADLVDRLEQVRPDVAFVALHGRGGEDGTVQELLELVGVPYTASRPGACIRCMDKVVAKHALRDAGIPTPDFYAFSQAAFEDLGAARALRDNVAFVPGRAAYLDGRGGSEMRLNFSGVGDDDIREGVRRIGKVVREQVDLYSTLTGTKPAAKRPENVVELRRRAG